MKHVTIVPDCGRCGFEMSIVNQGLNATDKDPWGTAFEAWFRCPHCGYETDRFGADSRSDAIALAKEKCGCKAWSEAVE